MPYFTISVSSGTSEPWKFIGVPESAPAAMRTPARCASWKLATCAGTSTSDFRTMYSGMPAARPPAAMAAGALRVGTRNVPSRRMWATISSVR